MVVNKAWDFAEVSVQFEEQKIGLTALAAKYGTTADAIIESVQQAAAGTISKITAMDVANRALLLGLNPTQIENFANVAERLSGVLGTDVAGAYEQLTQAVAAGQERQLKSMGVLIDFNAAYKEHTKSIGKSVAELSPEDKQQARLDMFAAKSVEMLAQLGPSTETAADKIDKFNAKWVDLKILLGDVLIPLFSKAIDWILKIAEVAKTAADAIGAVLKAVKGLVDFVLPKEGILVTGFENLTSTAYNAGKNFVDSFILGMQERTSASYEAVKSWLSGFVPFLKGQSPPPEGPLSELDEWGRNIPQTLAEGITANAGAAVEAMRAVAAQVGSVAMSGVEVGSVADKKFDTVSLLSSEANTGYSAALDAESEYTAKSNDMARGRSRFQISSVKESFAATSAFMNSMTALVGATSRKSFETLRAFSLAETIINTAAAIMAALKNPPGPPWSYAYAAAAAATGAAQIATILSTEPGSEGMPRVVGGVGVSTGAGLTVPQEGTQTGGTNVTIIINNPLTDDPNVWDKIVEDNIIPGIEGYSARNNTMKIKVA
ncbi:MAG: hypothetical protein HY880_04110 [Deltaproteobacteria bacterium]|nr:hypothetical protein [Deltaproteobacteria bacterium]